jgi:hypothetical protein
MAATCRRPLQEWGWAVRGWYYGNLRSCCFALLTNAERVGTIAQCQVISLSQRKPAPNAPWWAVADDDGDHILGELHGLLQPVITVSYIKDLVRI